MEDDSGPLRTERVLQEGVPNTVTLSDTLVLVFEVSCAVRDIANAFCSMPLATESQDQFALGCEGQNGPLSASPGGPMPCHMLWGW